jgi:DNA-binding MarR family transcriptional regulator
MAEHDEPRTSLRTALRDLRIELTINTYRVASIASLNYSDLAVLDILTRQGSTSPTALARRTGIHAATMTGVLSRLEQAGWIIRHPDAADRRAVQIEPAGLARLSDVYRDGNSRLDDIAAGLTAEQAAVVLSYLQAVIDAVHTTSRELAERPQQARRLGR